MTVIAGKDHIVEACRSRGMRVTETQLNLLESALEAEGALDGMEIRLDLQCIRGMPGESPGSLVLKGNLGQLLAVLERLWPALQRRRGED